MPPFFDTWLVFGGRQGDPKIMGHQRISGFGSRQGDPQLKGYQRVSVFAALPRCPLNHTALRARLLLARRDHYNQARAKRARGF